MIAPTFCIRYRLSLAQPILLQASKQSRQSQITSHREPKSPFESVYKYILIQNDRHRSQHETCTYPKSNHELISWAL